MYLLFVLVWMFAIAEGVLMEDYLQEESRIQAVLGNAVDFVAKEPVLLAQYESLHPTNFFPQLWPVGHGSVADDQFNNKVNDIVEHLGGPPEFYIVREGRSAPLGDSYPEAAMREVFAVYARARQSIIRSHIYHAGSFLLADQPSLISFTESEDAQALLVRHGHAAFWEHAEAAYIRLYSFWDRVAQVLDFSFFNIRKFDQNGFTSVMDRIHANAVPMDPNLKRSGSWKRLRAFQTSESEDGLKWLLQRRNLLVHSLHLHPLPDEQSVFKSQFNHLESAHRDKLRPRSQKEETELLLGQLTRASSLFSDFLTVAGFSPSRRKDRWVRD